MKMIGVVGLGYVGKAVEAIFSKKYKVESYDVKIDSTCKTLKELVELSDVIFICVPTPMNKDGSCNTTIVESVIESVNHLNKNNLIVAIKSTIPPLTTSSFSKIYKNINLIFNPEFLTEANFIKDFENQNRIILGGSKDSNKILENIYSPLFPNAKIVNTDSTTAEMIKYTTNTFLATKVSYANEIYTMCNKLNIDYSNLIKLCLYDKRLGESHWQVPGPDGKKGFGGSCFPKDLNALIFLAESLDINLNVLKSAWKTNLNMRPEKDWESLKGRAVVEEE